MVKHTEYVYIKLCGVYSDFFTENSFKKVFIF